jgi:uncharacterized membrane protein YtjA (UPF0391 family)
MRYYAGILFTAVIAAIFGLGGIALGAMEIATALFIIFLILFFGSLVYGVTSRIR